jgi:acetylornithine deacetylase
MSHPALTIDDSYLVQTLADLIHINSINPSLSPEGPGEAEAGVYVADALSDLGLQVTTYELAPGRVNVVGVLPGSGNGRSLLFNAHMDTVGVEGMTIDPFAAEIRDGRMYGRGTQDMKGSLAAMLAAVKALVDSGVTLEGDLIFTAVADEEYLSMGTEALVKEGITADAAIVTEPTDLQLARAHRGMIWYQVETFGRAAHGSRYQDGIDANMRMGRFLARLDKLEQELRRRPGHPLTGPPSLHAPIIHGGREMSIYADHCVLNIERRIAPGETEADNTAELQAIIDELSAEDPTFRAELSVLVQRAPFVVAEDAPIVQVVDAALAARLGVRRPHVGMPFWTDAALLSEAGIDTVLLGPVGGGLHSAVEWVDLASVADLAAVLAETAYRFCR